jgi:protein SDA1
LDSGGWIDVESDGGDHLNVSDSGDEDGKNGDKLRKIDESAGDVNRTSTLATTKVCVCVEGLSSTSRSI